MKKIHFIGIGGIGVSALAKYYLAKGFSVSGSDLVGSEITEDLSKKGVKVYLGKHKAKNISKDLDMVVFSPAVKKDNPELKAAKKAKSYPKALGDLTRELFTVAVSGTHGKSTTSSMLGILMQRVGLDPTVIVGTKVREFGDSNCRVGKSNYLVIEACEWSASFLNYSPQIIVLTNIEREHLDFFKDLNHILKVYKEYVVLLPEKGVLVANRDDKNIQKILKSSVVKDLTVREFSLRQKEVKKLRKILQIPGDHNVYNALAALAVARLLGVPDEESYRALASYKGSWRRFDVRKAVFFGKRVTLVNDYAHHPTELKAAFESVLKKFPKKRIITVFQPHQYQRTFYLFEDFVKVLSNIKVEKLIISDIYDVAGREVGSLKKKVSSEKLVSKIDKKNVLYIPTIKEIAKFLEKELKGGEVVMIVGAGNIYDLSSFFHLT